ncbi:MAG: hypothetical protein DCC65_04465 [Planctomycetota bacterium]|nr:MAG: hypothetical protein DCC65_04465 [Planctomycetota bacterium]
MLSQRLFFGALLIAALLGLLYVDSRLPAWLAAQETGPRFDGAVVTLVVGALAYLGTLELARLLRPAGHAPLFLWPAIVSIGLVLVPFAYHSGLLWMAGLGDVGVAELTVAMLVAAVFGTFAGVAARRRTERAAGDMATSLLCVIYIGLLAQFVVTLRFHGGIALLIYFVATVKASDIGAYFTGLALGRTKLIRWLSPKKTWEGLAGGVVASAACAAGLSWAFGSSATSTPTHATHGFPPPVHGAVFGLVMALVGQAGDLFESLIKRDAQSKDSASAIPAFGGVLDILDSILLTAPVACLLLLR